MSHSTSAVVPLLFYKVDKSEFSQLTNFEEMTGPTILIARTVLTVADQIDRFLVPTVALDFRRRPAPATTHRVTWEPRSEETRNPL